MHQLFVRILNLPIGGSLDNGDVSLTVAAKEVTESNAPVGAALIAQAMGRREGAGRYKAMQSIMDWDRSRLAYRAVKRAFDIVFSGVVLVFIAIPSLVLAVLIRLESEGSPFYSQIRVGRTRPDGSLTTFRMWKFRSMYKDADERLAELKEQNEIAGAMFKMKNDPRVTGVGKFLRKTSLDEFPQLFNVLKGDMSLVGPRPERPQFVQKFRDEIPRYMVKHQVRPGMTGWAQINGYRGDTSIEKRIEYDLYYIENWTMVFDMKILILTIFKGFFDGR